MGPDGLRNGTNAISKPVRFQISGLDLFQSQGTSRLFVPVAQCPLGVFLDLMNPFGRATDGHFKIAPEIMRKAFHLDICTFRYRVMALDLPGICPAFCARLLLVILIARLGAVFFGSHGADFQFFKNLQHLTFSYCRNGGVTRSSATLLATGHGLSSAWMPILGGSVLGGSVNERWPERHCTRDKKSPPPLSRQGVLRIPDQSAISQSNDCASSLRLALPPNHWLYRRFSGLLARAWLSAYSVTALSSPQAVPCTPGRCAPWAAPLNSAMIFWKPLVCSMPLCSTPLRSSIGLASRHATMPWASGSVSFTPVRLRILPKNASKAFAPISPISPLTASGLNAVLGRTLTCLPDSFKAMACVFQQTTRTQVNFAVVASDPSQEVISRT